MKSRERVIGLVISILLVATLAVACIPAEPVTEPAQAPEEPAPVSEPAEDAPPIPAAPTEPTTLIVAVGGDFESLDAQQLAVPRSWTLVRNLYADVFAWGHDTDPATGMTYATYDFQPGVAQSWERREEGGKIIYTIQLQEGCKFPSGNELTSKDFVYKVDRMQNVRPWNNEVYGCKKGAECIQVIDDYTFELIIDEPNPISDIGMNSLTSLPLDSEEMEKHHTPDDPWGHNYIRLNNVGVGAYKLDHMTPGVETLLVKDEEFCGPDNLHGRFDRILFKVIPSPSSQMLLLQSGEVDIAPELPKKETLDLIGQPGVKVLSFDSTNLFGLGFDNRLEPFDDVRVRQALAYAVPYEEIIDAVYVGQAQKPGGLITRGTRGATDEYWVYSYDLDKAKALLDEAGHPDGFEMDLVFDLSKSWHEDSAVLIQDSFAKVGVKVNLVKENPAAFYEKLRKAEQPAYLWESLSWINDAGYTYDMVWTSWGFGNYAHYENDELDQIIKDAWKVMDPDKRFQMYDRAQEILDTEVPAIVICQPNYLLAHKEGLEGFAKYFDEMARYFEVQEAE